MSLTSEIINILDDTLKLEKYAREMSDETRLLGNIAEFDSMAVVSVIVALEEYYEITVHDDELDAHVFESVGSLVEFVQNKLNE